MVKNITSLLITLGNTRGEIIDAISIHDRTLLKIFKTGEFIAEINVRSVRPGYEMHPKYFKKLWGKKSLKNLQFGDRLKF